MRGAAILHGHGGATPRFLRTQALDAKAAEYVGDGTQRWSAGHVADLAAFIRVVLNTPHAEGVFNVADETLALRDVAVALAETLALPGGARTLTRAQAQARWGREWAQMLSGALAIDVIRARSLDTLAAVIG